MHPPSLLLLLLVSSPMPVSTYIPASITPSARGNSSSAFAERALSSLLLIWLPVLVAYQPSDPAAVPHPSGTLQPTVPCTAGVVGQCTGWITWLPPRWSNQVQPTQRPSTCSTPLWQPSCSNIHRQHRLCFKRQPVICAAITLVLLPGYNCDSRASHARMSNSSAHRPYCSTTLWYSGLSGSSFRGRVVMTCSRRSCGCAQPAILRRAGVTTKLKHTNPLTGLPEGSTSSERDSGYSN